MNNPVNKPWTELDIDFLKRNYKRLEYKEIARILGRSYRAVQQKAINSGLKKQKGHPAHNKGQGEALCWRCAKATGHCSWSHALVPVPGWTSKTVQSVDGPLTVVLECPEFVEG